MSARVRYQETKRQLVIEIPTERDGIAMVTLTVSSKAPSSPVDGLFNALGSLLLEKTGAKS